MSDYSEYQSYYADFQTGYWADPEPEACRCKGHGWALSEVDTWHCCPFHGKGKAHPEDRDDEPVNEWEASQSDPFRAVCESRGAFGRECNDEDEADESHIPF